MGEIRGPIENPMPTDLIPSPTPEQKRAFLNTLSQSGRTDLALEASGALSAAIYLEKNRDRQFAGLWDLIDQAAMDRLKAVLMDRALVACGQVVTLEAKDPDTGEPLLDDDFQPIRVRRLINSNAMVMAKLIEKLIPSADKQAALVNISNTANAAAMFALPELPRMPRLINPIQMEAGE